MTLVLASASASRKRVLASAGVTFTALPAAIDEDALKTGLLEEGTGIAAMADALAEAKARDVARRRPGDLVIGADQTLLFEGALVSKCTDMVSARNLLSRLCGKEHRLVSALVLMRDDKLLWRHESHVDLRMRDFSDAFLDWYLAGEGETLLAGVGCYRLEGPGVQLFDRIEGDYFSVLGLPLLPLLAALREQV